MATQSAAAASHADLNRNSLFNLKGRVALVTGGGSGIGLMITQALAVNGAKVYITGRTPEKLDSVVETYGKDIEGDIFALKGFDVTDKKHIANLVKEIESREKCLCILVNNAGISSNTVNTDVDLATDLKKELFDLEKSSFDDWTSVFTTNVSSIFFTSGMSTRYRLQTIPHTNTHLSCLLASAAEILGVSRGLVRYHPQYHQHQRYGPGCPAPLRLQCF